jgi:restriction system protein
MKKDIKVTESEEEIIEPDGVEEVWREKLKEALKKMSSDKFEMFA